MNFKCLGFLCAGVVVIAGCGKATVPSSPAASTPSSPSSPASTTSMTVSSPAAGAAVASPFQVSASASSCQSQAIASIGYAIDKGAASQITGGALQAQVAASAGTHTLHVLAWGADGSSCDTDVAITVSDATAPPSNPPSNPPSVAPSGPTIPANAVTISEIQQLTSWQSEFDSATGSGSSQGTTDLVSAPSQSGLARQFQTTFANYGGERYHSTFGSDPLAKNFVYDAWVYVASPSDSVANIEMDVNQVMSNGQTVIYGLQCDGYSKTWDVAENAGTASAPDSKWVHTTAGCNVQDWSTDTWHHVQASYSRDDAGNITYLAVWLDGTEQDINQTVPSAFALGWSSVLLTNFQVDGRGASGSNTVYLDSASVSRW